jgi:ubiquinone/menaquinone biosynthesis C-methylase UbiE
MTDTLAREHAVKQWTAHPCGAVEGDEAAPEYFLEVERRRYAQQGWQRDVIRFDLYARRTVLEIGVGLGTDLAQFAKAGAECHGIDITDRHLEATRRNFAARGLGVTLNKSDASRIPYSDEQFDLVYSFGVIHHIPDPEPVVREIHRVLKPGGRCLVALYHKHSFFHDYMLFVRGLLLGRLFRLGYAGLLATIEAGADGVSIKPHVKLYSRRQARTLFESLAIERVSVHQLDLGRFGSTWPGRLLRPVLRLLEPLIGWYVVVEAERPLGQPLAAR